MGSAVPGAGGCAILSSAMAIRMLPVPANNVIFRRRFPSTYEAMSAALGGALSALKEQEWIGPDEEFYARLCLEEALVNAIRHGNRDEPDRQVSLELIADGDTCRISVWDEGLGFRCDKIAVPDCHHKGGRGLCLIKHFMDHVGYDPDRNCFEMAFRRKSLNKGG